MRGRLRHLLLVSVLCAGAPACALLSSSPQPAADDAHVVFLVRPDCPFAVVKTQGDDRFGILAPVERTYLRHGDMFVGPLVPGRITLRFLPFPEEELGPNLVVDVHAAGLLFVDAQNLWREVCGPDADPPASS